MFLFMRNFPLRFVNLLPFQIFHSTAKFARSRKRRTCYVFSLGLPEVIAYAISVAFASWNFLLHAAEKNKTQRNFLFCEAK